MKSIDPINCSFVSCSCAKTPSSVDWNCENGWIILGSSRNVALISPETQNTAPIIAGTFCGHEGDVTCVKWIRNAGRSTVSALALSGGTDSKAVVWRFDDQLGLLRKVAVCDGHSMTVSHLCGLNIDSTCLICTCSADSTTRIWSWNRNDEGDSVMETQVIKSSKNGFALCCDMRPVESGVILATGHDDKKIRLHWKSASDKDFVEVMVLSGHEDWIRGLSFQTADGSDCSSILLASCSQDTYVRIWRICGLLDGGINTGNGTVEGGIQLKRQMFSVETPKGSKNCTVTLDAVLSGHEDWVYSVQWHPTGQSKLLTASMDKCLIIWEPDEATGVWLEKARLGVVGGPVASGFYGGLFGPNAEFVLGHTFQGGFHVWRQSENGWRPVIFPSGHFGPVEDICWDVDGHYLLSCSADQTSRLYAPWVGDHRQVTIHELARPQVHGYDMQSIVSVNCSCFVSCSEEKILRAFSSTKTFAENLVNISKLLRDESTSVLLQGSAASLPDGACVPSLGLSNKAMFVGETINTNDQTVTSNEENNSAIPFLPAELIAPPTEDCLMQNTLWPEVRKLYGHGCEVFAIACNHAGTVVASAAKANKADQAQVILWSTSDWQQRAQIGGHTLTVTQISFSPDDTYLLTVSRDRTWCLYQRKGDDFDWIRIGYTDKKTAVHTRIIWGCSWTPDSKYFITVSRDKKIVAWAITDQSTDTSTGNVLHVGSVMEAANSVTAVAICPQMVSTDSYLVAAGLESGEILFYKWNAVKSFEPVHSMDRNMAHSLAVKRLHFRPQVHPDHALRLWSGSDQDDTAILASCSDDHSVKIFRISLNWLIS